MLHTYLGGLFFSVYFREQHYCFVGGGGGGGGESYNRKARCYIIYTMLMYFSHSMHPQPSQRRRRSVWASAQSDRSLLSA